MENIRKNAGYKIIKSIKLPNNEEYVLGFKITSSKEPEYVTWYFNNGTYCYGHYFIDQRHAYLDLIERSIIDLKRYKEWY